MKKRIEVLLLCVIILVIVGCSTTIASNQDELKEKTQNETLNEQIPFYMLNVVKLGIEEGEIVEMFGSGVEVKQGDLLVLAYNMDNNTGEPYMYKGIPYTLGFGFGNENSLSAIMCLVTPDGNNPKMTKLLFDEIDKNLTERYKDPIESGEEWINDRYKNDDVMFEKAVLEGQYQKIKMWQEGEMFIILNIKDMSVIYTTNTADALIAKQKIDKLNKTELALPRYYPIEEVPLFQSKNIIKSNEDSNGIVVVYESNGTYEDTTKYYHNLLLNFGGYLKQPVDNELYLMTALLNSIDKTVSILVSHNTKIDDIIINNPVVTIMVQNKNVYSESKQNKYAVEVTN